jgi:hypothetical protein
MKFHQVQARAHGHDQARFEIFQDRGRGSAASKPWVSAIAVTRKHGVLLVAEVPDSMGRGASSAFRCKIDRFFDQRMAQGPPIAVDGENFSTGRSLGKYSSAPSGD